MTLNYHDRIVRDPRIAGGEATIKGTRVTLRTVLASLAEGATTDESSRTSRRSPARTSGRPSRSLRRPPRKTCPSPRRTTLENQAGREPADRSRAPAGEPGARRRHGAGRRHSGSGRHRRLARRAGRRPVLHYPGFDFSDARAFAPGTHHGILLVRLPQPGRTALSQRVATLFRGEDVDSWAGCLVTATLRKVRVKRATPT